MWVQGYCRGGSDEGAALNGGATGQWRWQFMGSAYRNRHSAYLKLLQGPVDGPSRQAVTPLLTGGDVVSHRSHCISLSV